jgi:hypothetical protein
MKRKRIAPEGGYDFGAKKHYRRDIWSTFRKFTGTDTHSARALLLPSLEGDEIDVALSKGFREENLHIVDRNPAIVATLKRRYPCINTYGVEIERAVRRFADEETCGYGFAGEEQRDYPTFDVANLDLCANVNARTAAGISAMASLGVFDGAMVSVTMLRGREKPSLFAGIEKRGKQSDTMMRLLRACCGDHKFNDNDYGRLDFFHYALTTAVSWDGSRLATGARLALPMRADIYRSAAGTQTMMWAMFLVLPLDEHGNVQPEYNLRNARAFDAIPKAIRARGRSAAAGMLAEMAECA